MRKVNFAANLAMGVAFCGLTWTAQIGAQTATKPASTGNSSGGTSSRGNSNSIASAVDLAANGKCREALPVLKKSMRGVADKELKYRVGMAVARCAMSLDQKEAAAEALLLLDREFPKDPQVLYITTHYFSELASRASQELAAAAPGSAQAHQLQAEALESQGKWDAAIGEYQGILEKNPQAPGVHYRMGRAYLSLPDGAENTAKAKSEFEQELKIDRKNAASQFLLGEIARRAADWNSAIQYFTSAAKSDTGFAEAYLALGMSLNAAERFADAVAPLQAYTKMLPDDGAGHYQLSIAYSRTGRKDDAAREMAVQQELVRKNPNGVRPQE